jgi:hypothetical protein
MWKGVVATARIQDFPRSEAIKKPVQKVHIPLNYTFYIHIKIIQDCLHNHPLKMTFIYNISAHCRFILKFRKQGANNILLSIFHFSLSNVFPEWTKGVIPIFLWLIFLWPIFLWPKLLCVEIPTKNLLKYRSILKIIDFSRTTRHYFNSLLLLRVDISTDQSPYVSILQQTKIPMCRYSYRPKLQCVDIPTDQSSYVSIFLPVLRIRTTFFRIWIRLFKFGTPGSRCGSLPT